MTKAKSNKQKANYYVAKTIKLLKEEGYQVERLEVNHMVFVGGKTIGVKKDTFGSDLLAMSSKKIIFIQVKSSTDGKFDINTVKKEFDKFVGPKFVERQLFMGEPKKKPRIEIC